MEGNTNGGHRNCPMTNHPHCEKTAAGSPKFDMKLNSYTSDLNLILDDSGYQGTPLTKDGFAYLWAGAKGFYGIKSGKGCYEVKILQHLDISQCFTDKTRPHEVRVGFSCDGTSKQLGEDPFSYGFGGTRKTSSDANFTDYGIPFGQGDVVTAFVEYTRKQASISFAVNGSHLGPAFNISVGHLRGQALYPHVLTKNCTFEVNFGQRRNQPFFPMPSGFEDFVFFNDIPLSYMESGPPSPQKWEDCQILMMCGLPGSGKSSWVQNHCKRNPDLRFNILSTDNIMDNMTVIISPRGESYNKRWKVLIPLATKCFETILNIASGKLRNYILDQTNVYATAQKKKMSKFGRFHRLAVVIIPSEQEYQRRISNQRESGKCIPTDTILEMKAKFVLPEPGAIFKDVLYGELQERKSHNLVVRYNEEGLTGISGDFGEHSNMGTNPVPKNRLHNVNQPGAKTNQTSQGLAGENAVLSSRSNNSSSDRRGRGRSRGFQHSNPNPSFAVFEQNNSQSTSSIIRGNANNRGHTNSRKHHESSWNPQPSSGFHTEAVFQANHGARQSNNRPARGQLNNPRNTFRPRGRGNGFLSQNSPREGMMSQISQSLSRGNESREFVPQENGYVDAHLTGATLKNPQNSRGGFQRRGRNENSNFHSQQFQFEPSSFQYFQH